MGVARVLRPVKCYKVRVLNQDLRRELMARRKSICDQLGDGVLVLPSPAISLRNNDVEHEFRQSSDFFYLTGFEEPDCVLVLSGRPEGYVLFVRSKDPEREIWDGRRAGVEGARELFGADQAFPIDELDQRLVDLLVDVRRVYYRLGEHRDFDARFLNVLDRVRARGRTGSEWPTEIVDPAVVLHEARLFKSELELSYMRRAAEITADAHRAAMTACRPGMYEYEIEALLLHDFRKAGSRRVAYPCIVGSGVNATILHYRENNRLMREGDLLLIDAGAEWNHYAADVTRTFPVGGRFSEPQRALYAIVLEAQLAAIEQARPGRTLEAVHDAAARVIASGLIDLGFLTGAVDEVLEQKKLKPYFMHRTSHWLGMDVHDVGRYHRDHEPRPLEAGMVITVEPGIYVSENDENVPAEFRGIGIRIEDDVVITHGEPDVLTGGAPKTIEDVEAACAASPVS